MTSGRLLGCAALAGVLLAGSGCAPLWRHGVAAPVSHMAPHRIPESGTFFEGWFLRLTAPGALSIGALAASWHDRELESGESYLALFVQNPGAQRLQVNDAVLSAGPAVDPAASGPAASGPGGGPGSRDPHPGTPAAFRWELGDDTVVTERSMTIALPDGARFSATIGAPVFWNPADPSAVPEGAWQHSPWLKNHWFVHSTASPVRWTLTAADGRARSGLGLAHFEKNWGASFPRRWIWAQGVDPQTGTGFVVAGGDNPVFPRLPGGAWILGVRSPLGVWDYATARAGQELSVWPDSCNGNIRFHADGPDGRVEISIAAPPESFGTLQAPRADGFEPLSEMSFRGDAVLRLTSRRGGGEGATSTFTLPFSALEFGGAWRCAPGIQIGKAGMSE